MVEIRTPQMLPTARPAAQVSHAASTALGELGQASQQAANTFSAFYEKEAAIKSDLLLATMQHDWEKRLKEGQPGPGYAKRTLAEFDAYRADLSATAPKRTHDRVQLALDKYRLGLADRVTAAESVARARAINAAASEARSQREKALVLNPDLLSEMVAAHPEEAGSLQRLALSVRSTNGGPEADVEIANEVRAGAWTDALSPSQMLSLMESGKTAEAKIARDQEVQNTAARQTLANKLAEDAAFVEANGKLPSTAIPAEAAEQLFVDLGASADEASAASDQYQQMVTAGIRIHSMGGMSEDEANSALFSAQQSVEKPGNTPADVAIRDTMVAAYNARIESINKDPAGHIVKYNSDVATALDMTTSQDPAIRASGIDAYKSLQAASADQIGVYDPPLLPKSAATAMVQQLVGTGSDISPQVLRQMKSEWNDPRLVSELEAAGLAPEYAAAMRYADNPGLATAIIATAKIPETDLVKLLPYSTAKTDIDQVVVDGMSDYVAVLGAGDTTGVVPGMMASQAAIVRKLAMQRTANGEDAASAASRVMDQMFPANAVINTSEVKVIIPDGGPSEDIVLSALDGAKTIEALRKVGIKPLDNPAFQDFQDIEVALVAASGGVWLMNGSSTGAVLHYNIGGYYLPVQKTDGSLLEIPFADMKAVPGHGRSFTVGQFRRATGQTAP